MARDSSPGPSASEMRRHCTLLRVRANAKFSPLGPAPTMRTGAGGIVSTYGGREGFVHTQGHRAGNRSLDRLNENKTGSEGAAGWSVGAPKASQRMGMLDSSRSLV